MYSEDDFLMLSGIQHFAFCKRQWALIHIEMQWEENERTVQGKYVHKKVDNPIREVRKDVQVIRSMHVSSQQLGLTGRCDVVEVLSNAEGKIRAVHPVEYKSGRPKDGCCDEVQLCAQTMAIEEMMGVDIHFGSIYYNETRRRLTVQIGKDLRDKTIKLSEEMHSTFKHNVTPRPRYGAWCKHCSLEAICMPSVTSADKSVEEYTLKQMRD